MNTVLLITGDESLRGQLRRHLADYSVFEASTDGDAFKTLRLLDVDIVVRDSTPPAGPLDAFVVRIREMVPSTLTIAVGPGEDEADSADFVIPRAFTPRDLQAALRHAGGKQRLVRELAQLRSEVAAPPTGAGSAEASWDGAAVGRVLKEITRVLAAGFDLGRVLEMSLDAISELVRPARIALLLRDATGDEFRIAAQRGLAPQIVDSVRLSALGGLARWLAVQGRPAALHDLPAEIAQELKVLQGVMAIPLVAHGDLVAMVVLGQPVFGGTYGRRETEMLFDLATQLGAMIRDSALHGQLEREKEFTERILAHMSSGVITIGRDERVSRLNRRAEEILELQARGVVGQDLRALPSPLGDMLFETLSTGRHLPRSEVQIALRQLWLEVSAYPIHDETGAAVGAVLVLEDLTARKQLAAQKREAEQLQLLTQVVARIADEIKNPLVSINTFVELIGERYDDPDFRKHFSSVVRRDVRRLVTVFEKLAGLVTEGELNFTTVDAHAVVGQVAQMITSDDGVGHTLQLDVVPDATPHMIKVDAAQLRKALSYLVWYLTHNSPTDPAKVSISVGRQEDGDGANDVRILVGSRTATVSPEQLQRLFDPVQMVQESLINVGPAVSQRLVEALGGRLRFKQSRHELAFLVTLPSAAS